MKVRLRNRPIEHDAMCQNCNYPQMLETSGLSPTQNRLRIIELIGNSTDPISAQQIYEAIQQTGAINRVTVYRILDLLVQKGLVDKMSSGDRSFHFGLAPNEHHSPHPHFYCRHCGRLKCLRPGSLAVDLGPLQRAYPGRIENVEIRVDGICHSCLRGKNLPR